jgi:hypothetical protein
VDVIERTELQPPPPVQPAQPPPAAELGRRLRWFTDALAGVRTTASTELATGIRELRNDARIRRRRPDRDYPSDLVVAVAELGRRYLVRTHELTHAVATQALTGLGTAVPPLIIDWTPPALPPAPHRAWWSAEESAIAVSSVIGAATLARWTMFAGGLPAPLTAGLSVSLVLGVAWSTTSTRRSAAERNRLEQWTNEVLNDTRSALEAAFAQRLVDANHRMREVFHERADMMDTQR